MKPTNQMNHNEHTPRPTLSARCAPSPNCTPKQWRDYIDSFDERNPDGSVVNADAGGSGGVCETVPDGGEPKRQSESQRDTHRAEAMNDGGPAASMSLRDYFAAKAMQSLIASVTTNKEFAQYMASIDPDGNKAVARAAWIHSDDMLATQEEKA